MNQSNTATLQKTWMGEPLKQEPINGNVFHMNAVVANQLISDYNEPVVVVVPSGNYNEPREFGRYANLGIALNIVKTLDLAEYRIFSLSSGNEIHVH